MEQGWQPTRRLTQFVQRRPAVLFTIFVAIGIGFFGILPIRPWLWLGGSAFFLVAAVFVPWGFVRTALLAGVMFLIGVSAGQIERFQFSSDTISQYAFD